MQCCCGELIELNCKGDCDSRHVRGRHLEVLYHHLLLHYIYIYIFIICYCMNRQGTSETDIRNYCRVQGGVRVLGKQGGREGGRKEGRKGVREGGS